MTPEIENPKVAAAFDVADPVARAGLLALRQLIFDTAASTPETGGIEEALRWGQPAYLTRQRETGSTLRLGIPKSARFALFVHCQSQLIPEFIRTFPAWDRIEGTRAVLFNDPAEVEPIRHGWLIRRALTYHIRPMLPADN